MIRKKAREGYLLVKKGIEKTGQSFIVVTNAISSPDNTNFSDWEELPEQEALELQEKYNNNGDRNIN